MPKILRTIIALTILTVLALAASTQASAQEQDPTQILLDSAQAINQIPGFSAKVTLSGDGSPMILESLPSMTARFNMGTHSQYGKVLHLLGELRSTRKAPPEAFDIAYSSSRYMWTDHPKQSLNIRPPSVSIRQRPRIFSYLLMAELINDSPFESELASAESVELQSNESIEGTDCFVVFITRAKNQKGSASAHTHERWFIGVDDHLPRRVEHITDGGMIKATLIMELSQLVIAAQPDKDLFVFAPDSYRVSDTTIKQTRPDPTIPDETTPYTKPPEQIAPPVSSDPMAPNYTFTNTDAAVVSSATQSGRITTLYFFGSWSIPSKTTTPLFSELADEFAGRPDTPVNIPVDAFAIATRESDPGTLTDDHSTNNYAHALAINPPNNLPALFKIRVFPTIIVIDDTNRIIFKEHLTKDRDAQALIDEAKAAITKALK